MTTTESDNLNSNAAEAAAPPVQPLGRAAASSTNKGLFVVMGAVSIAAIVTAVSWHQMTSRRETGGARVASISPTDQVATDPAARVSPQYEALVREDNERAISLASSADGVVVPPIIGGAQGPAREPTRAAAAPPPTPNDFTFQPAGIGGHGGGGGADRDAVARKREAAQQLLAGLVLEPQKVVEGVDPATILAGRPTAAAVGEEPATLDVPLLQVIPAVVDVGANTDYPNAMVVRIVTGPLRGAKAVGRVNAASRNGPVDRVVVAFERVYLEGEMYATSGMAVDAATRIPAIRGDVDRHIVHNLITSGAVAFLAGYASGINSSTGTVIGTGGVFVGSGLSTSDAIRSQGASAVADQLSEHRYRGPTVTLPAGSPVGVVLLEPLRVMRAGTASIPVPRESTATPGVGPAAFGSTPAATPPISAVAPDGTVISAGPRG